MSRREGAGEWGDNGEGRSWGNLTNNDEQGKFPNGVVAALRVQTEELAEGKHGLYTMG